MPAVLGYTPPTDKNRSAFNGEVVRERSARDATYKRALKYYLGNMDDQLVYDPDNEDAVDDNVAINMVKITADRTVDFLFPKIPTIELDPESIDRTPEEIWVDEFLEENGGLSTLNKWALRGFLAGHSFIQVRPVKKGRKYPRISLLDPLTVTIYWNAEDVDEVYWYEVRSVVGKEIHIYDYVHNLERNTWKVYHYRSQSQNNRDLETIVESITQQVYEDYAGAIDRLTFGEGAWVVMEEADFPDVGLPPIIETPHLPHPTSRYGNNEANLKDLQDTINLIASLRNSVARESGVPIDVIVGAGTGDVEVKEDIWVVDSPNASVQRLQLKGDLVSMTTMLEKLIEVYLSISRVVLLKGEAKDLQRVTNASVRTLFLDQIAKNSVLQDAYGRSLRLIIKLALKMSDLPNANADQKVVVKFPNPLPTDFTELANQLAIIYNIGAVSKRTVATEMEKNWAFEQAAIESELEQDMERQEAQMELMQKFQPAEGSDESNSSKPNSGSGTPSNGNRPNGASGGNKGNDKGDKKD